MDAGQNNRPEHSAVQTLKQCSSGEVLWGEWDKIFKAVFQEDSLVVAAKGPRPQ